MPKYDSLRKLERNKTLVEYAKAHPDYSLREIGMAFNITSSRVCRILQKAGGKQEAKGNGNL